MKKSWISVFLVVSFFAWSVPAFAANQNVQLCFEYETNYVDSAYGDYYTDDSENKVADGLRYQVFLGYTTIEVASGWADQSGGCSAELTLSDTSYYTIKAISKAAVDDGNEIHMKWLDAGNNELYHGQYLALWWSPQEGSGDYTFVYNYNSTAMVSNVLASLTRSLNRRAGGITNEEHKVLRDDTRGSFYAPNAGVIHLDSTSRGKKFTPAHELGHRLLHLNNGDPVLNNYLETGAWPCASTTTGHGYLTKEFQTAAAHEGFANFYAAAVFNDNSDPYSCRYKSEHCTYFPFRENRLKNECSTPYAYHAVEGDWTRFLWSVHASDGHSVGDIIDIFVGASPDVWTDEKVFEYLYDSAIDGGFYETDDDDWLEKAEFHGVDY